MKNNEQNSMQPLAKNDRAKRLNDPLYRSSRRVVYTAMTAALLIVGKYALAIVPNVEVVTTLTVVFAYCFGWQTLAATVIFCAADSILYTPVLDVTVSYFIYWNLLALFAILLKKSRVESETAYLVLALVMTLFFGVLTSAVYAAFHSTKFWAEYLKGIVFYVIHLMSTLVFMSVGFKPLTKLLLKINVQNRY